MLLQLLFIIFSILGLINDIIIWYIDREDSTLFLSLF